MMIPFTYKSKLNITENIFITQKKPRHAGAETDHVHINRSLFHIIKLFFTALCSRKAPTNPV